MYYVLHKPLFENDVSSKAIFFLQFKFQYSLYSCRILINILFSLKIFICFSSVCLFYILDIKGTSLVKCYPYWDSERYPLKLCLINYKLDIYDYYF